MSDYTRYPRVLAENQPQSGKIFLQKTNIDLIRRPGISLLFSTPKENSACWERACFAKDKHKSSSCQWGSWKLVICVPLDHETKNNCRPRDILEGKQTQQMDTHHTKVKIIVDMNSVKCSILGLSGHKNFSSWHSWLWGWLWENFKRVLSLLKQFCFFCAWGTKV